MGGFHKRKKKRRKEALKKQEEALRRKRIEERKKVQNLFHSVVFSLVCMKKQHMYYLQWIVSVEIANFKCWSSLCV